MTLAQKALHGTKTQAMSLWVQTSNALLTALRSLFEEFEQFAQQHLGWYFDNTFGPMIFRLQGTEILFIFT